MPNSNQKIFPLGDAALTVEFGNAISVELNRKAIALSEYFESNPFLGFIESVPAYASTTVFYDLATVKREYASAFDGVRGLVLTALQYLDISQTKTERRIEIPVHFDAASALDLAHVAEVNGLTTADVIDIFTSREYRVFMLGFLPGFSYMGEVDERIATPRKQTPRTHVPQGGVGIAGRQTGIYSLASPGGWQIIGRTDLELFTPLNDEPSLLRAGDIVSFVAAE
ncbi:MAG: 5-oxoprolinase subunit PxpB [Pyrinomonadaceae bacterium]